MADLNAALQGGMRAEAAFGYADGSYRMAFRDGDETVDATSSVAGGEVRFAMSKDGLSYGGEGRESRLSMTASALPVPIEATVARTAFNMMLPVSRSDTAAPFAAMVAVVDLALSDGIWNLFDPGAQLPRDPATLIIDLSGAARMLIDVLDPVTAGRAELPGEIEALSLNQLKLSAAGAELSGQGAATFDNSGPACRRQRPDRQAGGDGSSARGTGDGGADDAGSFRGGRRRRHADIADRVQARWRHLRQRPADPLAWVAFIRIHATHSNLLILHVRGAQNRFPLLRDML